MQTYWRKSLLYLLYICIRFSNYCLFVTSYYFAYYIFLAFLYSSYNYISHWDFFKWFFFSPINKFRFKEKYVDVKWNEIN